MNNIQDYIKSLNTRIENLEKEKELIAKNDNINSKKENIEKKPIDKNEIELQSKVDNIDNENINTNIIELKSKIDKIENDNTNNINKINNRINKLENNEVISLKYSVLTKIRSSLHRDYFKYKLKNRALKMHFFRVRYENEINQLLNANKILHFRKFINIIYDELDKKIGGNKKLTKESYKNILNPNGKDFPIIYVEKNIEGVEACKITAIIDYFNFVKEECSNIIHLKKKNIIKEDIYLNHLIMMYNKINNFEKEYMQKRKEINEESKNENNIIENKINNINIEKEKDSNNEDKNKYSLKELCSFLFDSKNIDDNKLIKNEIEKPLVNMLINPQSESNYSINDYSSTKVSETNISNIEEKDENIKNNNENFKVFIEKFYNDKNEILFDELKNFINKNNDELVNKKIAINLEKIMLDLKYLQMKIKEQKEKQNKYEEIKKTLKNEIIQQISSQYFFNEYIKSFSIESYKQYVNKFNIKSIKQVKEKHYRFQDKFLELVKYRFKKLEDMKNELFKLIDVDKLINIFDVDPSDFIKFDRNKGKFSENPPKPMFFNSKK